MRKGARLSAPLPNVESEGINMSAKVIRVRLREILQTNQTIMLE